MFTLTPVWFRKAALVLFSIGLLTSAPARAAFLHGDALDTAADWIAIIESPSGLEEAARAKSVNPATPPRRPPSP